MTMSAGSSNDSQRWEIVTGGEHRRNAERHKQREDVRAGGFGDGDGGEIEEITAQVNLQT